MSMRSSRGPVLGGLSSSDTTELAGPDHRPVAVLLDDSAEGWRALLAALAEAAREGRGVRALLIDWPSWTQFTTSAVQLFCPCPLLTGAPTADLLEEYDAALRAHGHPPACRVASKRELAQVLASAPARLIVSGMRLGRTTRGPLGKLGQATLLVP